MQKTIAVIKKIDWLKLLPLGGIFALAIAVRIINLNYNSPFNDEAIYVVLGKMGLFIHDWWSYNAQAWVAGLPYVYPSLSALAYTTGGIVGSRLMSVFFGVLTVFEVYQLTEVIFHKERFVKFAASVAAIIVAFSATGILVSRLATYDAPSFFLLIFGINHILRGESYSNGRYYFLGALGIWLAFITKIIIAAFYPILVLVSFFQVYKDPKKRSLWLRYFLIPICLGTLFFFAIDYKGFLIYAGSQVSREHETYHTLLKAIWSYIHPAIILAIPATLIAFLYRKWKETILLLGCSTVVLTIHLLNHRWSTLDKHSFLTVLFLAPIIGFGLTRVMLIPYKIVKYVAVGSLIASLIYYSWFEYNHKNKIEGHWYNAYNMLQTFKPMVKYDDKILTEEGAATILDLYDKDEPRNITTFDWFDYMNLKGDDTYYQAIKDGYFDYIELDGQAEPKRDLILKLRELMKDNYHSVYRQGHFEIYARNY